MGRWIRVMPRLSGFWIRFAARIRVRKSGLEQLRNEVSTCEYEDVRVLWEMLGKTTTDKKKKKEKKHVRRSVHRWARRGRGALICCSF